MNDQAVNPRTMFLNLPYDVRIHSIRAGKSVVIMSQYCDELNSYFGAENRKMLIKAIEDGEKYHDIGKLMLSDFILKKTGKLTDSEWLAMKQHPQRTAEIIESFPQNFFPNKTHYEIVLIMGKYHHERYDGSGYPYGLKGDEIPLMAQLGAIADVFDALLSKRSYKNEISVKEANEIILAGENKHFGSTAIKCYKKGLSKMKNIYHTKGKL